MNSIYANYKKYLKEFLKHKSISTDESYAGETRKTVYYLNDLFASNGFKVSLWKSKGNNPVVFAECHPKTRVDLNYPTVLIYGHYDVQPAMKEDGWSTDPFLLTEKNNRLLGRGVVDNKGQVMVHTATIFDLIKSNSLKFNIKFLIEGNEETGNTTLSDIMKKRNKELKCDVVLISDGELTNNKPTVEVSLRGGFNCKIIYKTANNNLHSGMWGGAVPNAAQELSLLLTKIYNKDNSVNIKDFYKSLVKPTSTEIRNNKILEQENQSLNKLAGVKQMLMPEKLDFFTATGLMPAIQISGLKSGYIEAGFSNIVPSNAEVRLNIRTAPDQKSKDIMKAVEDFVKKHTPPYVDYEIIFNNPHEPVKVSSDNKFIKFSESILREVYNSDIRKRNVGGAIPFVSDVKTILGVDAVLVPLANEDCNMHGTDENFDLYFLNKAFYFSEKFFSTEIKT